MVRDISILVEIKKGMNEQYSDCFDILSRPTKTREIKGKNNSSAGNAAF